MNREVTTKEYFVKTILLIDKMQGDEESFDKAASYKAGNNKYLIMQVSNKRPSNTT